MLLNTAVADLGVQFKETIFSLMDEERPAYDTPAFRAKIGITLDCLKLAGDDMVSFRKMLDKFPSKDLLVVAIITGALFDFIYHHKTEMTDVFIRYLDVATDISNNTSRDEPQFGESGLLYIAEMMKNIHTVADTIHQLIGKVKAINDDDFFVPNVFLAPYTQNGKQVEIIVASYTPVKK
jgi:hypothetical protein